MQINSINNIANSLNSIGSTKNTDKVSNFSDFLNNALEKVNTLQQESTEVTNKFITGESDNIHDVMIAGSKADLALQMTLQVRNKVMDAYNEIMNMQV